MVCAEHLSLWESGIVVGAWQRLMASSQYLGTELHKLAC